MNTLEDKQGKVTITRQKDGGKKINVEPLNNSFIPTKTCETNYPLNLIGLIFEIKGSSYLCDEIRRDVDPNYVQRDLEMDLTGYFTKQDFVGKKILDFGCGSGASTMILSRMYPDAEIVGVELDESLLKIAEARLEFYKYPNIQFYASPSGNELPPQIEKFDFVIMSAVYEHLLPEERKTVIPKVWSIIKPQGHLFLNMTPYRWFPIEHHTTGLPFINYLPAKLAHAATRKFSKRTDSSESWETLLRRGIRGGTETEIVEVLRRNSKENPVLIEPSQKNMKDRIDLWYSQLNQENQLAIKKTIKYLFKAIRALSGATPVPNLSLVIKKEI
jgi:2-polyprenyl-3-methyl-5-hydroxy-6-metoxy-1,4-benzoquinol methylase